MFQQQGGALINALKAAGIKTDAAAQIAQILSNGRQELASSNPVKLDLTPRSLRFVTPEIRKLQLTNLDFRQADADYRRQLTPSGEGRPVPQQESSVQESIAPQATDGTYRVASGKYTDALGAGDAVKVDLRVSGAGTSVFLDPPGNTLVGKTLRAESGGSDSGRLRFFISETGSEVVWNLQTENVYEFEVVTNVEYIRGRGIKVTWETISAWRTPGTTGRTALIPVAPVMVVTDVTNDLVVQQETIYTLELGNSGGHAIPTAACP